jgi:hypothetical protein
MEKINTITERAMKAIRVNELTLYGYMKKYQINKNTILENFNAFQGYSNKISLHSEVLKIRLEAEKQILDFKYLGE